MLARTSLSWYVSSYITLQITGYWIQSIELTMSRDDNEPLHSIPSFVMIRRKTIHFRCELQLPFYYKGCNQKTEQTSDHFHQYSVTQLLVHQTEHYNCCAAVWNMELKWELWLLMVTGRFQMWFQCWCLLYNMYIKHQCYTNFEITQWSWHLSPIWSTIVTHGCRVMLP
jgi:hypothetical protein